MVPSSFPVDAFTPDVITALKYAAILQFNTKAGGLIQRTKTWDLIEAEKEIAKTKSWEQREKSSQVKV